jgi:serine/threonine protein kinase
MESDLALPRGFSLNEYRIDSTLGVGGFGLTYLATDSNLNLKVAIKEYLPNDLALRDADRSVRPKSDSALEAFNWGRSRFLDESRTLASFRHPNIVRVMRFFEANQTAYMVMEFVAGTSLSDWITVRRPASEAKVVGIATALLDGLEVVHRAGYLHRDIKPANVFIRDDESPVLLDFGSARATRGVSELTAIITPGYAPLEQYHATGNQGPWSDLYSLGAVLYWMVIGSKPVESVARIRQDDMLAAVQAGDRGLYSQELLEAIDWALTPAEEHRPQSVAQLRDALKRIRPMAGSQDPTVMADLPRQMAQPPSQPASTSLAAFDREAVRKIEAALAGYLGPIAGVTLRAAAKNAISLAHLIEIAAREIEDSAERTVFLKRLGNLDRSTPSNSASLRVDSTRHTSSAPSQMAPSRLAPSRIAPSTPMASGPATSMPPRGDNSATRQVSVGAESMQAAEAVLVRQIGAVAKVVVRRAAGKARDETEFFLLVSDEIEDVAERKAFLRRMMASIGK